MTSPDGKYLYTSPPNWPTPPGFVPPEGWLPEPEWGPAPHGWEFWRPVVAPPPPPPGVTGPPPPPASDASTLSEDRRRRRKMIPVLLVLLLIAGGAGVYLKNKHDKDVRADKARAAAAALQASTAAAAKEAAHQAAVAKSNADHAERVKRKDDVRQLQDAILKDANSRISKGELEGPAATEVICTPVGGGSTDDLTALTGQFQCTAVNTHNADGTQSGYRFSGTINYNEGNLSWHLGS